MINQTLCHRQRDFRLIAVVVNDAMKAPPVDATVLVYLGKIGRDSGIEFAANARAYIVFEVRPAVRARLSHGITNPRAQVYDCFPILR